MSGFVVGVDLATAQARAVAMDLGTGRLQAVRRAPLPAPVRGPDGHTHRCTIHDVPDEGAGIRCEPVK